MTSEWKECKVGDYVSFQNGYAFKSKDFSNDGQYRVVKIKELKDGLVRFFDDTARIDITNDLDYNKYKIYNGDILFALTGDPVSKPNPLSWVGRISLYTHDEISLLNQRVCKALFTDKIYPKFFYYYFRQNSAFFELAAKATGSASQANISTKTISDTIIKIPCIEEQQKIADILSIIDDKIALNTAINENLEQQAQAIFKSWFVDFEPFGGVMPDDWYIGNISDLAKEIICGKTPSTKKKEYYGDYMPFITIPDMHNCVYAISTERYLSELGVKSQEKKTLHKNSICVSCIGTAGLVVLVSVDSQTNQQINSIVPKDNYSSYCIYLLMQTMSEKINRLGQSGSTIVNLNKAQFGIMEALVPSITSMNDFDSLVQPLFEQILTNQQENQRLAALRDTLLPKLMNGEIDVSEVKI